MLDKEYGELGATVAQLIRTQRVLAVVADRIDELVRETSRVRRVSVALDERIASIEAELYTIGIRLQGAYEKEEEHAEAGADE